MHFFVLLHKQPCGTLVVNDILFTILPLTIFRSISDIFLQLERILQHDSFQRLPVPYLQLPG